MRRVMGMGLVLLLLVAGCSSGPRSAFDGFREIDPDEVLRYRIEVSQKRTASGLGEPKTLASKVVMDVEEEPTETGYVVVVRNVEASGESSQEIAAQRLIGRRVDVNLKADGLVGDVGLFAGTDDLAAADVGILAALFAPVLPSARSDIGTTWRTKPPAVNVPWTQGGLRFTVDHEVIGSGPYRELEIARVRSEALANVRFRLPLVVQQPAGGGGGGGQPSFIVNELFEQLFTDISNPIEGFAAAIAAIPLAVVAPFLAIGEAIGNIFGGSRSSQRRPPDIPDVDLAGPLELRSNTAIWRADGRVLDATGKGSSRLTGTLPQLPGRAADLSGKPLILSTTWSFKRTLTSPWPQPREIPGRGLLPWVAVLSVVAGAVAATLGTRRRRRHRSRKLVRRAPVRDTVGPKPADVDEPELVDA